MGMYEVDDAERADFLYLSQIDVAMVAFMKHRKTLIADVATRLLLESKVVITDSFFFTSQDIRDDIGRGDRSWVLRGLKRGLIVPAFREVNIGSFGENWVRSGMQSYMGVLSEGQQTADALDNATGGNTAPRITWPERVGTSYGELMNRQFAGDVVDGALPDSVRSGLWRETRGMRSKYLELAWQRSNDRELHGLRRADIYSVIAKDVGFDGDPSDKDKVIERADPDMRDALRATLLWVDELYHFNHATRFKVRPSFPVSNGPGALVIPEILMAGPGRAADLGSAWAYSHEVRWPSRDALRTASPDTLLGLASGVGEEYRNRLIAFRAERTDDAWDAFKTSANHYSEEICNAVGSLIKTGLKIRHIRRPGTELGPLLAAGGVTGPEAGSVSTAIASMFNDNMAALYIPTDDFERATRNEGIAELKLKFEASNTGDVRVDLPSAS
jgi:hypothetical protein